MRSGVFLLGQAISIVAMMPIMYSMMGRIAAYAAAHPEGMPEPVPGQVAFPPELMPDFTAMQVPIAVVGVATALLWFSAVVRRLHDRGRSGWWAAPPLLFQLSGLVLARRFFEEFTTLPFKPSGHFRLILLNSLFFWLFAIYLIVVLAGEGSAEPNRYGTRSASRSPP